MVLGQEALYSVLYQFVINTERNETFPDAHVIELLCLMKSETSTSVLNDNSFTSVLYSSI